MSAVTILGRGPDWKECMFHTDELWGAGSCLITPELSEKPFTKIFIFDGENLKEIQHTIQIARERKIPIVSTLSYADEKYPLVEITRRFHSSFFRNTISYMLGYAAYKDYKKIYIHGIGGGNGRWDYEQGKHFILFWQGVLHGLNVDCRVGHGSWQWLAKAHGDMMEGVLPGQDKNQ